MAVYTANKDNLLFFASPQMALLKDENFCLQSILNYGGICKMYAQFFLETANKGQY